VDDSHAQQALVEGPGKEGIQEVLMDQGQAQDTPAEPEPGQQKQQHEAQWVVETETRK